MYQALYRKYRPLVFDDLVGQGHITSVLENQIHLKQVSHAYLFSGTRGTGKTSAAKIFARAINCQSSGSKPCNSCPACQESLEESAIDIVEIDAASNNGVDNIRDLRDKAFYQPASLTYKVYIIDEVHMLSKGAFNALLKILEEPPSHLVFILATTEPERIPLTILSRCQKFQFNRIGPKVIENRMRYIAEEEGVDIEDRVYKVLVSRADGSMRDGLSIMDQLVSSGRQVIDYDFALDTLGLVSSESLFDLLEDLIGGSGTWVDTLDDILNSGKDVDQLSSDILGHFRNLMLAKVSGDSIERFIFTGGQAYIDQAKDLSLDFITSAMNIIIRFISESRLSSQKRALLEIALVEIGSLAGKSSRAKSEPKDSGVLNAEPEVKRIDTKSQKNQVENIKTKSDKVQVENIKTSDKGMGQPGEKEAQDDSNKSGDLTLDDIRGDWKEILQEIRRGSNQLIHAFLVEASLIDYDKGVLTLGFMSDYSFHMEKLSEKPHIEAIEKTLKMFYNRDINVKTRLIETEDKDFQADISKLEDIFQDDLIIK